MLLQKYVKNLKLQNNGQIYRNRIVIGGLTDMFSAYMPHRLRECLNLTL